MSHAMHRPGLLATGLMLAAAVLAEISKVLPAQAVVASIMAGWSVAQLQHFLPDRPIVRIGLTAQNTLRRARGEPEIGPDGKIIEPDDGKTAAKPGKTTAAAKSSKKG